MNVNAGRKMETALHQHLVVMFLLLLPTVIAKDRIWVIVDVFKNYYYYLVLING